MNTLILSYHCVVIFIVILTFLCTMLSLAKVGCFRNVPPQTTKILTGALLVEMVAAFIGVYKALPQLKMDVSEQYRFEITYDDLAGNWIQGLSEEDKVLVNPFINNGGMSSFLKFRGDVEKYREIKNLSTDWINHYVRVMRDEQKESSKIYLDNYSESPGKVDRGFELMKEYARKQGSSKKSGNGRMWASISGEKMTGIVVYTFPDGIQIPTVLQFEGKKSIYDDNKVITLSFTQKESVVSVANVFFDRPGGSFVLEMKEKNGVYVGALQGVGSIKVELWEL